MFGHTNLQATNFFEVAPLSATRGHIYMYMYERYKQQRSATVRSKFLVSVLSVPGITYVIMLIIVLSLALLTLSNL